MSSITIATTIFLSTITAYSTRNREHIALPVINFEQTENSAPIQDAQQHHHTIRARTIDRRFGYELIIGGLAVATPLLGIAFLHPDNCYPAALTLGASLGGTGILVGTIYLIGAHCSERRANSSPPHIELPSRPIR